MEGLEPSNPEGPLLAKKVQHLKIFPQVEIPVSAQLAEFVISHRIRPITGPHDQQVVPPHRNPSETLLPQIRVPYFHEIFRLKPDSPVIVQNLPFEKNLLGFC